MQARRSAAPACPILVCFATWAPAAPHTHVVHPAPDGARSGQRRLLKKLAEFLHPGPDSTGEMLAAFATAEQRQIIDAESRAMLEGALRLADMSAGDVMLAAPRMVLLDIDAPYEELLAQVIDSGHSRLPVCQEATRTASACSWPRICSSSSAPPT